MQLIQYLRVISDPVNQIQTYTEASQPDFCKPQLNASIYMSCSVKASNETAMIVEIFGSPSIIYLVVKAKAILFSTKSKRIQNGK